MHFLYMDESGTADLAKSKLGHFVLLGIAIPVDRWGEYSEKISEIKKFHYLRGQEIHTAWMAYRYPEQERIPDFEKYDHDKRRILVEAERQKILSGLGRAGKKEKLRSVKKNYKKSKSYIHLTHAERVKFLVAIGEAINSWPEARLFADAIQKGKYGYTHSPFREAFEQVVTRFQTYLKNRSAIDGTLHRGAIIQDQNSNEAIGLTKLMRSFYKDGSKWREIDQIVETPLFVDSQITEMVQVADFCAYATRRYFDNNESVLFQKIYRRFDMLPSGKLVGLRHFTGSHSCPCDVCVAHGRYSLKLMP